MEKEPLKRYNVLFWNCHGADAFDDKNDYNEDFISCVVELLTQKSIHILCMAECKCNDFRFENKIKQSLPDFYCFDQSDNLTGVGRLKIYTFLDKSCFSLKRKSDRFLNVRFLDKIDLCFLHLKSLVATPHVSKVIEDTIVFEDIVSQDGEPKFFIGDFNSSPYSDSLLNSNLFNTIRMGEKTSIFSSFRKESKTKRDLHYNPCWMLFGNCNGKGVYGTIDNDSKNYCNLGRYFFDQVIFNEKLLNYFDENSLEIVDCTNNRSLINVKGLIDTKYSDHLPIFFSLKGVV